MRHDYNADIRINCYTCCKIVVPVIMECYQLYKSQYV